MNKKKVFSYLFIGLLAAGATGTVTSCKDYDDDINSLQKQIKANADKIAEIEKLVKGGSVITNVAQSETGVTVTLSNGKSFNLTNGKDGAQGAQGIQGEPGKPGTAWTIGEDGYWYCDGKKTDNLARGPKGEQGEQGIQGEPGAAASVEYYVPNPETHHFDIYKDGKKVKDSGISFVSAENNTITATLDSARKNLILSGLAGYSDDVVISLTGNLTSLVFMPKLYMDGIETVNYPYLAGTTLVAKDQSGLKNHQGKSISGNIVDYQSNLLPNDPITATGGEDYVYGPTWTVQYHMNPANANTEYSDVKGYNVLQPEVMYVKTRAEQNTAKVLGVTSPEKKDNGAAAFLNDNGILTAGLKIAHPDKLNADPTSKTYQKDNTIALQVKSKDNKLATEEATITSDYALLNPLKAKLEALAWAIKPMYGKMDLDKRTETGDEKGLKDFGDANEKVHIWDSPKEALADTRGAALELYYNGDIDLKQYINIHYAVQNYKEYGKTNEFKSMTLDEAREWGLTYEFKLVDYKVDGNKTADSKFATWKDEANGVLKANNVDENGNPAKDNRAAIDREPLVQVLVKNADGNVVLDGYILLHITEKAPEDKIATLDTYPAGDAQFDLCNAVDGVQTTWSQFNKFVLSDFFTEVDANGLKKEEFDAMYTPEVLKPNVGVTAEGNQKDQLRLYATTDGKTFKEAELGDLVYVANDKGTTNHTWTWTLSEEEVEKLTHHAAKYPVTVTRYFRYNLKEAVVGTKIAPYKYIYVKVTVNLTRKQNTAVALTEKISNHWFDAVTGADGGKTAIVNDIHEPISGGYANTFNNSIAKTFVGNKAATGTLTNKYYFVPKNVTITAQNGKTYTITAKSSATDTKWNALVDKYVEKHTDVYDETKLADQLNACAVDYNEGVFTNNALYAVYNGVYTKIATLTQDGASAGQLKLINNAATKDVLNAIGYKANHGNIADELRTYVGVIASSGCGVAVPVTDGSFLVSWQRPINLNTIAPQQVIDAKEDGNIIYLSDLLNLYDWRNDSMEGANKWYWAYYGVKAVTVNVNPSVVETNMHQANEDTFVKLGTITKKAELYTHDGTSTVNKGAKKFTFDLSAYNSSDKNQDLLNKIAADKAIFGAIYYKNNGENVTKFTLKIPVTISYTWGDFYTTLVVTVDRTKNN